MSANVSSSRTGRASRKASKNPALEFKSATLTVPALFLADNDLDAIEDQLRKKIDQAADFFRNSPLLIDLQSLNAAGLPIDLSAVVELVRRQGLVPIGIRGGSDEQCREALAMDLPTHSLSPARGASGTAGECAEQGEEKNRRASSETGDNRSRNRSSGQAGAAQEPAATAARSDQPPENRVITQPVRSGQRVYARGDLTVTASVSAGAEIMAEGNIHVYGTLRGRALAGVLGNTDSRIFCMDLQAELLSIAGIYQLRDDINREQQHKSAQVSLQNQTIVIKAI